MNVRRLPAALAAFALVLSFFSMASPGAGSTGFPLCLSANGQFYTVWSEEDAKSPANAGLFDFGQDGNVGGLAPGVESVSFDNCQSPPDADGDGVLDERDNCPTTPPNTQVDETGCVPPPPPVDTDGDGVYDESDTCPGTPPGTAVGSDGCALPPSNPTLVLCVDGHTRMVTLRDAEAEGLIVISGDGTRFRPARAGIEVGACSSTPVTETPATDVPLTPEPTHSMTPEPTAPATTTPMATSTATPTSVEALVALLISILLDILASFGR